MWRKCLHRESKSWGLFLSSVSSRVPRERGDCLGRDICHLCHPPGVHASAQPCHHRAGHPLPDPCSPEGTKASRLGFKLVTGAQDLKRAILVPKPGSWLLRLQRWPGTPRVGPLSVMRHCPKQGGLILPWTAPSRDPVSTAGELEYC